MEILQKYTRFRAYQLGNAGSSFSYCDGKTFTLIEARLTEMSESSVRNELEKFSKTTIDVLHITSWDNDHCRPSELRDICIRFNPRIIEYPGYEPHTDDGKESLLIIHAYEKIRVEKENEIRLLQLGPSHISSLPIVNRDELYTNIIFHPKTLRDNSNDNSTVKLFRSGSFTVLSLGDVESPDIAEMLMRSHIAQTHVDVMILAHHGANNGFTTDAFLKKIKPLVTVCSSNYANQFEHPKKEIRDLLYQNNIKNFTTKTGDVIIESTDEHRGNFKVSNLVSNNQGLSSVYLGLSKRLHPKQLIARANAIPLGLSSNILKKPVILPKRLLP